MDFGDILKKIAPTAATMLLGPLGGMAVSAIGEALGIDEPTQEKIEQAFTGGQLSGEQIAAVKLAEVALKQRLAEFNIRAEELVVEDRQGARQREMKVGGITVPLLAWVIVGAFVGMAAGVLFGGMKADSVIAGTIIGYMSAKAEQVLSYYFGSSRGSEEKTGLISKMTNAINGGKAG